MALTELCELVSLQPGEEPANQLRKWRIERDNADMNALSNTLDNTCNQFATYSPADLINVSSGRAAKEETKTFLLGTLEQGEKTSTSVPGWVCSRWFTVSEARGKDQNVELCCREWEAI